jgi:hypothetical protein
VIEALGYRRWVMLYWWNLTGWKIFGQYMVCPRVGPLAILCPSYAPCMYSGVSVDKDGEYVVIEMAEKVWILIFDIADSDTCSLLETYEISSLDVVDAEYMVYYDAMGSVAEAQLQEVLPVMANIYDAYVVNILNERVAYVSEYNGNSYRIYRYVWIDNGWKLEGPFELVGREEKDKIRSIVARVSGVYSQEEFVGAVRIVVEDGELIRWWHTYKLSCDGWVFCSTHHAVTQYSEDNEGVE